MNFWLRALIAVLTGLLSRSIALPDNRVQGYVLHLPTNVPVADAEVILYARQHGQWNEVQRQRTDAQGRFEFAGPFAATGSSFSLSANYKGIPHFTSALEAGAQQQVIIEVYEPRQDEIPELRIVAYHLFLALRGDELEVAHLVQIDNPENWTYVGHEGIGEHRWVTEFVLPPKLFGLQSHAGKLLAAGQNLFYDTQPLLPGFTQISFTFSLDARQLRGSYIHHPRQPTDQLNIFIYPSEFDPGPPFESLGIVDLNDSLYRRLRLTNLQPGQTTLIPLPLAGSWRWALKWAALALSLLAALVMVIVGYRFAPVPSPLANAMESQALHQYRNHLLEQLAWLDDAQSSGKIRPQYQAERTCLLAQARTVFHLLEEPDNG